MTGHNCFNDPEGCTDACDARAYAAWERSHDGRVTRHAMRIVGVRRNCTMVDVRRCRCGDPVAHTNEIEAERERIAARIATYGRVTA